MFGLIGLVWLVWFDLFGLVGLVWFSFCLNQSLPGATDAARGEGYILWRVCQQGKDKDTSKQIYALLIGLIFLWTKCMPFEAPCKFDYNAYFAILDPSTYRGGRGGV